MCRGVENSGRRCPCDTAEARRLRRKKQAATERNSSRAVQSPILITPNDASVGTVRNYVETSIQQVAQLRNVLNGLREDHVKHLTIKPNPMGVFTAVVDGEKIVTRSRGDIISRSESAQEKQVSLLGQHVNSLVAQQTKFTDEDVRTIYEEKNAEYVSELKTLVNSGIKARIAFLESLPDDVQNAKLGTENKLVEAKKVMSSEQYAVTETLYNNMVKVEADSAVRKEQLQQYVKYGDPVVQGMLAENIAATRQVLSSLKPMGGEIRCDMSSESKHLPALQAAGALYPSDWVAASNDSPHVMIVRESAIRGHYKSHTVEDGQPELSIYSDSNPYNDEYGYRVGVHEFAHRLEHTADPFIYRMEEKFLEKRTTLPDGSREPLRKMVDLNQPGDYENDEVVYPDNFAHVYMGKTYNVKNREILSMGMESIFCGSNGALIGLNDFKPDADMKNFIIGMLAS